MGTWFTWENRIRRGVNNLLIGETFALPDGGTVERLELEKTSQSWLKAYRVKRGEFCATMTAARAETWQSLTARLLASEMLKEDFKPEEARAALSPLPKTKKAKKHIGDGQPVAFTLPPARDMTGLRQLALF